MRRLLAPLTRWLDRRIDARIGSVPTGHAELVKFATQSIHDASAVQSRLNELGLGGSSLLSQQYAASISPHDRDPGRHGLSVEWVALDGSGATGGMLDTLPPVGASFFQVVATDSGTVLLSGGIPLPDNHVTYGSVTKVCSEGARAIAIALLRAADLTSDGPASGRLHEEARPHAESPRSLRENAARGAR